MEMYIVAVYDKCAGKLLTPFFMENHETAKRQFKSLLNEVDIMRDNPEQFELLDLGLICGDNGNIIGNNEVEGEPIICHPEIICKGTDL